MSHMTIALEDWLLVDKDNKYATFEEGSYLYGTVIYHKTYGSKVIEAGKKVKSLRIRAVNWVSRIILTEDAIYHVGAPLKDWSDWLDKNGHKNKL